MPEFDLISEYADEASLSKQTEFILGELKKLEDEGLKVAAVFKTFSGKLDTKGSNIKDIVAGTKDLSFTAAEYSKVLANVVPEVNKLTNEQKKNLNLSQELFVAEEKQRQGAKQTVKLIQDSIAADVKKGSSMTELAKNIALNKAEQAKLNRENLVQAKLQAEERNTLGRAEALILVYTNAKKKLNLSTEEGVRLNENYNKAIAKTRDYINANADAETKRVKNIGNYPGTAANPSITNLSGPIATLNKSLDEIRIKIKTTGQDTPGFDKLKKEEELLVQLTQNLSKVFKTPWQVMRELSNAAKSLGVEFGKTNQTFQDFVSQVGEKKDEIDDIQKTINFQASDTKYLDGIVSAVSGLAGAYGAAQSASVIFGDDNEELQKQMVKLQAILTLVTSLQAVLNAVQTDGSAVQTVLAVKTGVMNAARTVQLTLSKLLTASSVETDAALLSEVAAAEAATAALVGQTAATDAAAVANTGLAGTTALVDGALVGEAAAAGTATTATTTFATTLIATGIGALVLAVAAGVSYLVVKIKQWSDENASVKLANEAVSQSLVDLISATKEYNSIRDVAATEEIGRLEFLSSKQKEAGVNAMQSLALDKSIAEKRSEFSKKKVAEAKIDNESLKNQFYEALGSAANVKEIEERKQDYIKKTKTVKDKDFKDKIEQYDSELKLAKDDLNAKKTTFDENLALFEDNKKNIREVETISIREAKLSSDERRKLILETARLEVETAMLGNEKILANERSTQQQKIDAFRSGETQRKKLIEAELTNITSDPTKKGTAEETIAIRRAGLEKKKVEEEVQKSIFDLNESYRKRRLAAELSFNNSIIDYQKSVQQQIISDENISLNSRIVALESYASAERSSIEKNYNYTVETSILTKEELEALDKDYSNKLINLTNETQNKLIGILEAESKKEAKYRADKIEDIKRSVAAVTLSGTLSSNAEIQALNERRNAGTVSEKKAAREREEIEFQRALKNTQIVISELKAKTKLYTDNSSEIEDIQNRIYLNSQDQSSATTEKEKIELGKQRGTLNEKLESLKKDADDRTEILTDLSNTETSLDDAVANHKKKLREEQNQDMIDVLTKAQEVADKAFGYISSALNVRATILRNSLEDEKNQIETNAQAEIEAANASVGSAEEKAAKIAIINARAEAKKEAIHRREKEIQMEQAKFQKMVTIFNIILATALNITKAITPWGKALAAIEGAVQLAIAVATPIPKFRSGLDRDYEGPAIVGDGGKREAIIRKGGKVEITPDKDTLTFIEKGDRIHPDAEKYISTYESGALIEARRIASGSPVREPGFGEEMNRTLLTIEKNSREMVSAINGKEQLILGASQGGMVAIHKWGARQVKYIDEQTNWS